MSKWKIQSFADSVVISESGLLKLLCTKVLVDGINIFVWWDVEKNEFNPYKKPAVAVPLSIQKQITTHYTQAVLYDTIAFKKVLRGKILPANKRQIKRIRAIFEHYKHFLPKQVETQAQSDTIVLVALKAMSEYGKPAIPLEDIVKNGISDITINQLKQDGYLESVQNGYRLTKLGVQKILSWSNPNTDLYAMLFSECLDYLASQSIDYSLLPERIGNIVFYLTTEDDLLRAYYKTMNNAQINLLASQLIDVLEDTK